MRLVHISDLHLGFRQFQRSTPSGANQREADVAATFARVVDQIIAIAPDVVLVAGDVFHTVRPTNPAILHGFKQFGKLTESLPKAIVVVVAGNHDMPRSTDTRCILRLFETFGVHVADTDSRRLNFPDRDLFIQAVPELPGPAPALEPDPGARWNILLAHGLVDGPTQPRWLAEELTMHIPRSAVEDARWDYVGLGHFHVYERVAERAFYSGATDYVSHGVWEERSDEERRKLPGKLFIERDLETGKQRVHKIESGRTFTDLPAIEGKGLSAADLDRDIQAAVARVRGGVDGKALRLVLRDVPRHIMRELDYKALRDIQRRALHFQLDARAPDIVLSRVGAGAPGRPPSLSEMLRDSLRTRVVASDIDREALVELGLHYLREAEHVAVVSDRPASEPAT